MKKILTLAICAGILSPFIASAQLVTVGPGSPVFHLTVTSPMSTGAGDLFVPPSPAYTQAYFTPGANTWTTGSLNFAAGNMNFVELAVNPDYFKISGAVDIGFIGNESDDLSEISVNSWNSVADVLNPAADSDAIMQWDAAAGGLDAPQSFQLNLDAGQSSAIIQFAHENLNPSYPSVATQSSESRFTIMQRVDVNGNFANEFLFAISDRAKDFDGDEDDGFFYIKGAIVPVPEPSQIAALALLGMGAFMIVRRRFRKN